MIRETRQAGTLSPVELIEQRLGDRKRHSESLSDGGLATKQGEGGRGKENTAISASQRGLWAVYWFGHFFIIVIMVFSVLFAYMSHRVTHGAPYSGGEIAPFA